MNLSTLTAQVRSGWHAVWSRRNPREQRLLGIGVWLLGLAVLWVLALGPALHTWQEAPARQALLDAQSQRMRQLQAQAQSLQKPVTISRADAAKWLEKSLTELGPNCCSAAARAAASRKPCPADCIGPCHLPGPACAWVGGLTAA